MRKLPKMFPAALRPHSTPLALLALTLLALSVPPGLAAQTNGKTDKQEAPAQEQAFAAALQVEKAFTKVAERAFPSIVTVTSYERVAESSKVKQKHEDWMAGRLTNDYPGYKKVRVTSGFFINDKGHVICCRHGILKGDGKLADLVSVETQDQNHTICTILGSEPTLNLGVLRLDVFSQKVPPRYQPIKLGNSASVRPGLWAIGAGDPDGPEKFYGVGIFTSVPDRDCYQEQLGATYMQAAMKVHDKAYGGPILNIKGEVMGMLSPRLANPAMFDPMPYNGIEFALPINIVQNLYTAIIKKGSHRSPWIGIAVMSRPEIVREKGPKAYKAMAKPKGASIMIENVFNPSPAYAAGVRPGDWMLSLGVNKIGSPFDFQRHLYLAGIDTEVTFGMWRDGKEYEVKLKVEPRPKNASFR